MLCGPAAGVLFVLGTVALAATLPRYSHVRQTVSEIGEAASPVRIPFAILLCAIAACSATFAFALRDRSLALGHSALASYLTGWMAVAIAGVGIFAYPHPLHNVFGLSEVIGYQAPLFLAFGWKGDARVKTAARFSWLFYLLIVMAIGLNLTPMVRHGMVWNDVQPIRGLVQRALFIAWFGWCFVIGLVLFKSYDTETSSRI
jgi:hypothetical protein